MIFPCCRHELPEKLGGVERAICSCGMPYLPKVIIEYNEMMDIIAGWSAVVCGKAHIKCEPGEGAFVADLVRRGMKYKKGYDVNGALIEVDLNNEETKT